MSKATLRRTLPWAPVAQVHALRCAQDSPSPRWHCERALSVSSRTATPTPTPSSPGASVPGAVQDVALSPRPSVWRRSPSLPRAPKHRHGGEERWTNSHSPGHGDGLVPQRRSVRKRPLAHCRLQVPGLPPPGAPARMGGGGAVCSAVPPSPGRGAKQMERTSRREALIKLHAAPATQASSGREVTKSPGDSRQREMKQQQEFRLPRSGEEPGRGCGPGAVAADHGSARRAGHGTDVRPTGTRPCPHVAGGTPAGSHGASLSPTSSSVPRGTMTRSSRGAGGTVWDAACTALGRVTRAERSEPRRQHVPGSREPETGRREATDVASLGCGTRSPSRRRGRSGGRGPGLGQRPAGPGLWAPHSSPARCSRGSPCLCVCAPMSSSQDTVTGLEPP